MDQRVLIQQLATVQSHLNLLQGQVVVAQQQLLSVIQGLAGPDSGTGPPAAPGNTDPELCQHPKEKRLDARSMGNPRAWICSVCGFKGDTGLGPEDRTPESGG